MSSYQYRKSHCGDKTILRRLISTMGFPIAGKMISLYWIRPQVVFTWGHCHGEIWRYQSVKQDWTLHFWKRIQVSQMQGPMIHFFPSQVRNNIPMPSVCGVERVDFQAFSRKNMGQVLLTTSQGNLQVLYFQAKVRSWVTFANTFPGNRISWYLFLQSLLWH